MAVGVAKLNRHLRARASPTMKIDLHAVFARWSLARSTSSIVGTSNAI
jgi:hypothetical protein